MTEKKKTDSRKTPTPKAMLETKRSTEANIWERHSIIEDMALRGTSNKDILFLLEETHGIKISLAQLFHDKAKISTRIKEYFDLKREHHLTMHLARRELLYKNCFIVKDYKTALAVLIDVAKLQGFYEEKGPLLGEIIIKHRLFDNV